MAPSPDASVAPKKMVPTKKAVLPSLTAGACAGVVTKTAVQPLDRVKSVLQIQGGGMQAQGGKYSGVVSTFRTVLKEGGPIPLWKENTASYTEVVPVWLQQTIASLDIYDEEEGVAVGGQQICERGEAEGVAMVSQSQSIWSSASTSSAHLVALV